MADGDEWLGSLGPHLKAQRALLGHLLRWTRAQPEARYLVVGCSLARGTADWMSDLDTAMGVSEGELEDVAARLAGDLKGMGELVGCFSHRLADFHMPHRRIFAQYADRSQLDLVVVASGPANLPGTVVLYDPDGWVTAIAAPSPPAAVVGSWAGLAWAALADLGKYLRRGSWWEAHTRLEEARGYYWRLLAVAEDVPEPQYGLTSLLDAVPRQDLPADAVATVAGVDGAALLAAGARLALLLADLQGRLALERGYELPGDLARFVTEDLRRV